jgi:hypothetical protein
MTMMRREKLGQLAILEINIDTGQFRVAFAISVGCGIGVLLVQRVSRWGVVNVPSKNNFAMFP